MGTLMTVHHNDSAIVLQLCMIACVGFVCVGCLSVCVCVCVCVCGVSMVCLIHWVCIITGIIWLCALAAVNAI